MNIADYYNDELGRLIESIDGDLFILAESLKGDTSDIITKSSTSTSTSTSTFGYFQVGEFKYEIEISTAKSVENGVVGVFRLINNKNKPTFSGDIHQYLKDKEELEMGDVDVGRNSIRIILKICTYFKEYIEKNKPEVFIFHARNDNRAKHYDSFGRILAKETGYSVYSKKDEKTGLTEYRLYKSKQTLNESIIFSFPFIDYCYIENYVNEWDI